MYNVFITNYDAKSQNVLETISPIYIDISKVLIKDSTLSQLVDYNCGHPSQCIETSSEKITIGNETAVKIDTKSLFDGKKVFFTKTYEGRGMTGSYLFTITMRSDKQTKKLFDISNEQNEFNSILNSFTFTL